MNKRKANCVKILYLFFFFTLVYHIKASKAQIKSVILKGTTINRESKALYLVPYTTLRVSYANKIEIPIKNNSFQYVLNVDTMLAYKFIFKDELEKGAYNEIVFFPDTNEIVFSLYDMDNYDKNTIKGGFLNSFFDSYTTNNDTQFKNELNDIYNQRNILTNNNQYYSDYYLKGLEALKLARADYAKKNISQEQYFKSQDTWDKVQNSKEAKTILGQKIDTKLDSLNREIIAWKYQYLSKNINLGSAILILNDFSNKTSSNPFLVEKLVNTAPTFVKTLNNHPYSKLIQDKLNGLTKIAKGNIIIDVLAKNLDTDNEIQLASLTKSKLTLVDLWGSWCGPCIAKTKTIKPLYEKYHSQGFNIIGIAREFKSLKAVKNRVKMENYTWPNLYDLDDKYQIWNKYGIGNGTGLMVLVNEKGEILAIDPSADEVEEIIKSVIQ